MSSDSEELGESSSDKSCCCDGSRALDSAVAKAIHAGVKFQDPFAVYIDPQAEISPGAWIGAGSHILGNSRIERSARIGPNAIVEDSIVGADVEIHPFSTVHQSSRIEPGALVKSRSELRSSIVASDAEIGPNALVEESQVGFRAKVGPFCRVRAGSCVEADAYIGTQAEVKSSRIGPGSKVGHFSFIGDAELGQEVNVGAGTVTANFDGREVQRTVIEDSASIGAGSVLIAPVSIGRGARTGSGAVVTRDVADGELVVGIPARVMLLSSSTSKVSVQ